jgi:hypothetical protein
MDSLIKALPAVLAASQHDESVTDAACLAAWKHAVGVGLSANAVPICFANGRLEIAVADRIWKAQLESFRTQLIFRLNSILGGPLVRRLEISIDPDRFRPATKADESTPSTGPAIPIDLLSAAAASLDTSLRRAFLGAAASCVKRIEGSEV